MINTRDLYKYIDSNVIIEGVEDLEKCDNTILQRNSEGKLE